MRTICLVVILFLDSNFNAIAQCDTVDLALGKPATASSAEGPSTPAANAFDGDTTSRWSSTFSDPQFIYVDLGAIYNLCRVTLFWENALGSDFTIDVSNDATTWIPLATITGNSSLKDTISVAGSGRYVRMNGSARGTAFGYSLYEFSVFGFPTSCNTANLAQGQSVTVSSTQAGLPAANAIDGDKTSRWASDASDPQFIYVDLGSIHNLCQVALYWEAAFASSYNIDVSDDANTWTTIDSVKSNAATTNILNVTGNGRYVRMLGLTRATGFGYSLFEFQVRDQTVLPILLIDFEAINKSNQYALLEWTTGTEVNNRYFAIERSIDGTHYIPIGQMAGAGNSTSPIHYHWMDSLPLKGINYYRLQQVNLDGGFAYSKVLSVNFGASPGASLSVYPNPVNDFANVTAANGTTIREIRIYNSSGAELRRYRGFSTNSVQIRVSTLGRGLYSLKVVTDKGTEVVKLIK